MELFSVKPLIGGSSYGKPVFTGTFEEVQHFVVEMCCIDKNFDFIIKKKKKGG